MVFRYDLRSNYVSYWRDTYSKLPSVSRDNRKKEDGVPTRTKALIRIRAGSRAWSRFRAGSRSRTRAPAAASPSLFQIKQLLTDWCELPDFL